MSRTAALSCLLLFASLSAAWGAMTHTISQKNKVFSQSEITLTAGDSLKISNEDAVTHSLFAKTAEYNIRETQPPGGESTFTFEKPGVVELRCAIHPQMLLKVTVKP